MSAIKNGGRHKANSDTLITILNDYGLDVVLDTNFAIRCTPLSIYNMSLYDVDNYIGRSYELLKRDECRKCGINGDVYLLRHEAERLLMDNYMSGIYYYDSGIDVKSDIVNIWRCV